MVGQNKKPTASLPCTFSILFHYIFIRAAVSAESEKRPQWNYRKNGDGREGNNGSFQIVSAYAAVVPFAGPIRQAA
ncbi:hypothetical protein [Kingella potus]|uniref:hypothetical protein n=1 Tax=Kingella potus TaxID=265175 RepID=UPI000E1B8E8C|nr:hypothetical protein [Kingella potus]UOP00604.1 hypothetical protein LVJ84_12400 [Kingella potus]